MANSHMYTVKILSMDTIEMAHNFGRIAVRYFDEDMAMLIHQTVGMYNPVITFTHNSRYFE